MASEFKKKRRGRRAVRIVLIVVAVLAVGAAVFGVLKVRQSRQAMSAVDVQTAAVERGTIIESIDGSGNLEAAEVQGVLVPVGVTIDEVQVQVGDTVKKGDVLATVNAASVAGAIADIDDSIKAVNNSLNESGVSSYEREELTARRDELQGIREELVMLHDNPVITATADGTIGSVGISDGEEVSSATSASSATSSAAADSTSAAAGMGVSYTAGSQPLVAVSLSADDPAGEEVIAEVLPAEEPAETEEAAPADETEAPAAADAAADETNSSTGTENTPSSSQGSVVSSSTNVAISNFSGLKDQIPVPTAGSTTGERDDEGKIRIDDSPFFDGYFIWKTDGEESADEVFQPHTVYTAEVHLTAKPNHCFTDEATINGLDYLVYLCRQLGVEAQYSEYEVSPDGNEVIFILTFPETGDNPSDSDSSSALDYSSYYSSYSGVSSVTGETYTDTYNSHEGEAFTIILMDNVKLKINVDELDILEIEEGQKAVVTLDAVDGVEYEGTIERVSSTASGSTGSAKYTAEIVIPMDDNMRIGMSASATIVTGEAADVLTLPMVALQESDGETFVYTSVDESTGLPGTPVTVTIGMADGTTAEITSGLDEGDLAYYTRSMTDDLDYYY